MKAYGDDYQVSVTEDEPIVHDNGWTDAYLYDRTDHTWEFFDAERNARFRISALADLCSEADAWEEAEDEQDQIPLDPYEEFGVLRSDFYRPRRY